MKYFALLLVVTVVGGGVYYFMNSTQAPAPSDSNNNNSVPKPSSNTEYSIYTKRTGGLPPRGDITLTGAGFLFSKDFTWPVGVQVQFKNNDNVSHQIISNCPELSLTLGPKETKSADPISVAKVCNYSDEKNSSSDHRGVITTK